MSEQNQQDKTSLDELNQDGAGAGATAQDSTFEPEEPEHPADDK